jgi:hypothetical protein
VVIQAWQTSNATAQAVGKGHRTIVSAGYYLDLLNPPRSTTPSIRWTLQPQA